MTSDKEDPTLAVLHVELLQLLDVAPYLVTV